MIDPGADPAVNCDPPDVPVMPDQDMTEVGSELHKVLDEVLTETTAGWAKLACELAEALRAVAPDHPLLQRVDVQRVLDLATSAD